MTRKASAGAGAAAAVFLLFSLSAWAQGYTMRRTRQPQDLPPALRQSLEDRVSADASPYLDQEDEKKAEGKTYTDLQQYFEYLPNREPNGNLIVSVKLGGPEYKPKSKASSKGAATGRLNYLVFSYARRANKWVEMGKPRWESQNLGRAGAGKITRDTSAAEKRKAAVATATRKNGGSSGDNAPGDTSASPTPAR